MLLGTISSCSARKELDAVQHHFCLSVVFSSEIDSKSKFFERWKLSDSVAAICAGLVYLLGDLPCAGQ